MKIIAATLSFCVSLGMSSFAQEIPKAKPVAVQFVDATSPMLKSAYLVLAKKADAGDGLSQLKLGLQYYAGDVLKKDDAKALRYLAKAHTHKIEQAADALKIIHFNLGVLAQKNNALEDAASHFSAAALLGDTQSKERLAEVEDKLIPDFPPAGTGLKNADGLFPTDIEPHPISALYEYVFACLEDIDKAIAQPDFSRSTIVMAYGTILVSKGNGLFTLHDIDPVTAEALYRGLRPHTNLRVVLQDEGATKKLIFAFK